jgi:hypothetical protein
MKTFEEFLKETPLDQGNKIYIAGPMSKLPKFNFDRFDVWRDFFEGEGWDVFSPADNDRSLLGKPRDWMPTDDDHDGQWYKWTIPNAPGIRKMLGDDLSWISLNANAIFMLNGWEQSSGAFAEWSLAKCLRLRIVYEGSRQRDPSEWEDIVRGS